MSEPVNQHYLPQFYLEGFTSPTGTGLCYVMKRENLHWVKRGVKNIAAEDYLHSFKDETGGMNHQIEEMLSRLEKEFSKVLAKVLNRQVLTTDETITLATFLTVTWQRVPGQVQHWNDQMSMLGQKLIEMHHGLFTHDPAKLEAWKAQHKKETGEDVGDKLRPEDFSPERVKITANRHATFMSLMNSAVELSKEVCLMEWTFFESRPPDFFIASDYPVCIYDPTNTSKVYGTGLRHINVEVTMPLSRTVALSTHWRSQEAGWFHAPKELVAQINFRTAKFSQRELIAPTRSCPGLDKMLANRKPLL